MKKLVLTLFFAFLVLMESNVFAQDVQKLPDDPRVRTGKLANGLTYYIVKNKAVKEHADFAIAQKAGTTLETSSQKGMCKLLELLSTRGTRNFTDSTIVKYLNSIGVSSKNIIFETKADNIQYLVKNVPISNQNTMDSALLIMYNWLASINIDEEDIAKAMPMLKNSIMDEWDAEKRIDDKIMKELYPKSPYAKTITLNQINKMSGYSSKELRGFYYNWFRPDLQAVFVVGDVDLDKVETQIKSIFATIPKPLKAQARNYYHPKMVDGTKVVIYKDPEYNKTSVSIQFQKNPLLSKYKLTSVPYIEEYFNSAISSLLYSRIQSGIISQNLPISNLKINQGKFMEMTNMEEFAISFETLPGSVYSAVSFLSGEINRMAQYGFNSQEFANSREIYFRELENLYDTRFSQPNSLFMKRAVNNYLQGYSLASIEMHFEIMKEIIYTLKLSQLNNYAKALLGQRNGVVISCRMPQIVGLEELSKDRIESSFINSIAKSSNSDVAQAIVKWPKYNAPEKVATISQVTQDAISAAEIVTLSNGIIAVLKKTEGSLDTISFRAISKGGLSVMNKDFGKDISLYINDIANLGGLGNLSRSNLEKLFAYNNVSLNSKISDNTEELYGYCGPQSIEKLFHLINLSFTQRRADENAFSIYKKAKSYQALYKNLSPTNVFEDSVTYYNSSNKRLIASLSEEYVNGMNYYNIFNAINARFANPSDFIFIFTGDINYEQFKEYIIKYLGGLKTSPDKENWVVNPEYPAKGKIQKDFWYQMVLPRTYIDITLSSGMEYNVENSILCRLFEKYLSGLYSNGIIKELSPRSKASCQIKYYPEEILLCNSRFETDSASAQLIIDAFNNKLNSTILNGISNSEFNDMIKSIKLEHSNKAISNNYWIDIISKNYILGKDFHTNYLNTLNNITPDKFVSFIEKIYRRGNMISVTMEGTTEDVKTMNLFKENKFIKDFFDL